MQWIKHIFSKLFAAFIERFRDKAGEDVTYKYRASMSFDMLGELLKKHKDVTITRDGVAFIAKAGSKESRSVYLHDALAELLQKTRRP